MGTWTSARNEVHIVQVKTQILLFFLVYSSTKVFYLKVFSIKRMRDGGRYIILLIFILGKSLAQEDGEVAPGAKLGQNLGAVDSNAKREAHFTPLLTKLRLETTVRDKDQMSTFLS